MISIEQQSWLLLRFCYINWYANLKLLLLLIFCLIGFNIQPVAQESNSEQDYLESLVDQFGNQNNNLFEGRFTDGEELIFSLDIANTNIGAVLAIIENETLFLNFDEYISTLDFPINYSASNLKYKGWFINEQRTFLLDIKTNIEGKVLVEVESERFEIDADNFRMKGDQLYLSQSVLTNIFEIGHQFNYQKLELEILPPLDFPLLAKLNRQGKLISRDFNRTPSFVNLPRSYELISPQILDISVNASYREQNDALRYNYGVSGARDLALLHTQFNFTGSDNGQLSNARLNFSRESQSGNLFGNTGITKFEIGDVRAARQGAGQTQAESLGFILQNNDITNNFDSEFITIDGDIPQNWDAELYRNGVLLKQQFDISTGRYEFVDVRLLYGLNNFEVLLFGPQGQIRRRTLERLVDERVSSKKPLTYQVSFQKLNSTLIGVNEKQLNQDLGYSFSSVVNTYFNNDTSINLGFNSSFGGSFEQNSFNLGVAKILFDDTLVDLNLGHIEAGATGLSASLRTRLWGQAFSLNYQNQNISNKEGFGARQALGLSLNGDFRIANFVRVPYSQTVSLQDLGNETTLNIENSLGLKFNRFSLFHNLSYERIDKNLSQNDSELNTFSTLIEENTSASVNLQTSFGRVFGRLSASYSPDNEDQLIEAYRASLNWQPANDLSVSLNATKDLIQDSLIAALSLGYLADNFRINGRIGYSEVNGYDIGVNASFSLSGSDSSTGLLTNNAIPESSTGKLHVRVFFDKNLNAIFDDGDSVLSNVAVKAPQFYKNALTNDKGIATFERLPNQMSSDILIDKDSLPEIFLVPIVKGVSITARRGLVDSLDYPVVISSEIDGLAEIVNQDGSILPLVRAELALLNAKGEIVQETTTEYDGYYAFIGVTPGEYSIELQRASVEKNDIINPPIINVTVSNVPDFLNKDLSYKRRAYMQGYASKIGEFKSSEWAKFYIKALRARGVTDPVYLHFSPSEQDFVVFTHFDENEGVITPYCDRARNFVKSCEITPLALPLP